MKFMNQYRLILILLVFLSTILLKGMHFSSDRMQQETAGTDTLVTQWKDLLIDSHHIPEPALNMAINGFYALKSDTLLTNDSLLTIVDFSSPSTRQRFYVLDLKNLKIIKNTWVAHGMESGVDVAESFSNIKNSYKSSLGLYLTRETYEGKHGYSLRLDGMSKGLNDNARERAIVVHGASYVSEDFIEETGRLGRSFGCPALPMDQVEEIIDLIKGGSCLFIYHPDMIPISKEDLEKLP